MNMKNWDNSIEIHLLYKLCNVNNMSSKSCKHQISHDPIEFDHCLLKLYLL